MADLFKALTGKNPAEYEKAAQILVDTPDIELFKKLVKQDEFLFDFIKNNVSNRIKQACTKDNFCNLLKFTEYYSPSYDSMFADVLYSFGGNDYLPVMKDFLLNGTNSQKAYAIKFLALVESSHVQDLLPVVRDLAKSEDEFLANNSIELLSINNDKISKNEAIRKLDSSDEFEQYEAVKFLVTYGDKGALSKIIEVMKKSSLSENIASEIPYLVDLNGLLAENEENGILVLCNIINAIPEIIPIGAVIDYNLFEILENLYYEKLSSASALLLRMAKEKFESLCENEEYLFDCDKNTKDEVNNINNFLKNVKINKLNSLLYDELFDESDFVFFAVDYVDDVEELETLLDSSNQTLVLKVLTKLKEKQVLNKSHKDLALNHITSENIKQIVAVL